MDFSDLATINVLYVEDEKIIRENITDMLQEICHQVFAAEDGKAGIDLFIEKQEFIDVVITDIQMPRLSGIDLAKEIRAITFDTPIIFTTAFSDSKYLYDSINIGVDAYVEKPVDMMQLLPTIKKAILPFAQRKALVQQAFLDKLTGLSNRSALDLQLEKNLHSGIMLIDIHEFRIINDIYGNEVGNFVLQEFAKFLEEQKKDNWNLYRVGSDDFAFLMFDHCSVDSCSKFFSTFQNNLSEFYVYHRKYDITISVSVTVGASLEKDNIIETADMALKTAKKKKKEFMLYSEECNYASTYQNDIHWVNMINLAIKTKNIKPYFQPIVDKNNKIVKFESLMRLIDGKEVYSPSNFLDIAKKSRTYKKLTFTMLEQVFDTMTEFPDGIFSINLSHIDILDNETVEYILSTLKEKNIGQRVIFEILEDESIDDIEKFIEFVQLAKDLGCKIAIDDFGAGYSNFSYMLDLQPDVIKIDGSLIRNIDTDKNSYIITNAIVNFTKLMQIETVAEYVHSKEVFEIVKKLNLSNYQGFLFSEPVPKSELKSLFENKTINL